jgi:hypothetical protein
VSGARRHRRAGWIGLLALLGAWPARGETAPEIEGRVTDGNGRPLPGADIVITDADGRGRRAAIADAGGRFVVLLSDGGWWTVTVYTERGARVASVRIEVPGGSKVWLEARDGGADMRATALASAGVIPGVWPSSPARDRDLRTGLAALPGAALPATPVDGPVLLGTDPAEAPLRLDGFVLNDPVSGRAPWELPASLFAAAVPSFGLGEAALRESGQAGVDLQSRRAERRLEGELGLGAGLTAPAGEAQGTERPQGWSPDTVVEGAVGAVQTGGRLRGHLALAPGWTAWEADPESTLVMRGRRARTFPVLGRADAEAGGWELGLLGLGSVDRWSSGRAARILPAGEATARARDLLLLGGTARRPARTGPGELVLQAGLLSSSDRAQRPADPESRTTGRRATFSARASSEGTLYGWHQFGFGTGADLAWGRRPSREPGRQAGVVLAGTRASSRTPWVAFDERYRPRPLLEVGLGIRLEKSFFSARAQREGAAAVERDLETGFLIAPRLSVCLLPAAGSVCLTGGRFGAALPLYPLLDTTAAPRAAVGAPAEDTALLAARGNLGPAALALFGLHRQTAHVIEDRFSPADGTLELHEPRGARRRLQALGATALVQGARTRAGAGLVLARLTGNQVGYLDASSGQLRPAATAAWDTLDSSVNSEGPLPFDRPTSARVMVEHRRPLGGFELRLIAQGRWDAGTPLSALGRSPVSGIGQVFLVQRGSLGRTAGTASLDLLISASRPLGGMRLELTLEGFNVTNNRPVMARDQVYTDLAVAPLPGAAGRAALGQLMDGENPVAGRPTFGNPVTWAEPLLVRLRLGLAF